MLKLLIIALMGTALAEPIKVVGLDDKSGVFIDEIQSENYITTLTHLKDGIDQQLMNQLNPMSSPGWSLSKVSFGLGMTGEIGIGPYKYGTALKQRFIYSR